MKKGINCWALPSRWPLKDQLALAAKTGYDGVELTITENGILPYAAAPEQLKDIKRLADEYGLEILSVACSLNWQCSLTSDRQDIREKAKANIRRQIDMAKALGCSAVLALPGFVGLDFHSAELFADPNRVSYFPGDEQIEYDAAYDRSLAAFRELAPYAEENGVSICVENTWSKFLLSPLEMRAFLDEIGSPCVKCYFDVGNVLLVGYPQQWIRILGKRIERVHVKDFRRGTARLSGFVELLTGDVDFSAVRQALEQIGYDGYVTAEINAYLSHPELTAGNCMRALRAILEQGE